MDLSDSKITTIDEPKNQQGKQSLTYKFIPVLKEKELSFVPIVTQWPITFPADSAFNKWIYQDPENNLYSLSPRGISKNSKLLISASDLPAIRAIDKFYLDQDENIYIISSIRDNPSIDKSLVNDLENANTLYIKTKNGYIQSTESQLNNSFSDVYVDKHLNKWFSSYSNGIYLLPYSQRAYTHYEKYRGESVTCLGMGPRGNVFIGSSGNTIQRFNRNSWEQEIQLGPSNISNYISKVQLDTLNNILWCGWEFGLLKLNYFIDYEDTGNLNSTDVSIIPVSQLYDLVQISDSLLLCATDLGVKKIDLTNGSELKSEFSSTSTALSITKDHDGVIWFDQGNSLYFSEKNIIKELSTNNLDIQHKISDIELCHDGSIAVATQGGGIYFIKNKKVVHNYRMSNGLPSNSINKIQISGNTHYAASNKGIVSYEWNNESTKNEVFIKAKNGLPSDIVNDVLLADSMLYLATPAGLVIFKTNFLAEIASAKSSPPNLEIKSFSSKDSIFNPAHEIKLSYSQSFFKIDYHALVYDQPNFVEYSYRFSSNDEWQITKSTSLEFPKFESGSYSFQLRAKHYNSNWSKPKIVNFQALPPWWNTWWARGIYLLLLIGIGFIIARIYAKRKYEKQLALIQKEQALLEERNRISADMHDDLGSELTKVVILSQIARTKLNLPKEKEQPILAIGDAASGIVKKMNEIIWALNPSNDTLESLIAYLQNYVNEYLEVRDLNGRVIMPDSIPDYSVKAVFRRNSFLG